MIGLEEIFTLEEPEIFKAFLELAKTAGMPCAYRENSWLWIKGTFPVCLTAHVDTVESCNRDREIHVEREIVTATRGGRPAVLGADDRAGVFILQQLLLKHRPHAMLFAGEEKGCLGARDFVEACPDFSPIRLFIGLDAAGSNRLVWYGDAWQYADALRFMAHHGFRDDGHGSSSDIAVLSDYWRDVPGVNLSVGYHLQHTVEEYLNIGEMLRTRDKVSRLLRDFNPEIRFARSGN